MKKNSHIYDKSAGAVTLLTLTPPATTLSSLGQPLTPATAAIATTPLPSPNQNTGLDIWKHETLYFWGISWKATPYGHHQTVKLQVGRYWVQKEQEDSKNRHARYVSQPELLLTQVIRIQFNKGTFPFKTEGLLQPAFHRHVVFLILYKQHLCVISSCRNSLFLSCTVGLSVPSVSLWVWGIWSVGNKFADILIFLCLLFHRQQWRMKGWVSKLLVFPYFLSHAPFVVHLILTLSVFEVSSGPGQMWVWKRRKGPHWASCKYSFYQCWTIELFFLYTKCPFSTTGMVTSF